MAGISADTRHGNTFCEKEEIDIMRLEMSDLLDLVLEEGASDLHIPCFSPPVLRIHGEMTPLDVDPMQP